ncbi:MAG: exonuclease SbcCD subunit D [Gaiellaceae bacterium]|jgi:DNA repair exonuclease SbcCD nuclease subunit
MFDEVGAQLMVRFIHTADWHLGMQAHFLPAEARSRFAEDRFSAVGAIGDLAREEACSFVVVAGDVFDSNHVDRQVIAKAVDELSSFTVPVFLLPANHDALDASSVYRSPAWLDRCPAGVTVLEELVAIPVGEGGAVEIVGVPWLTKRQLGDPVAAGYEAQVVSAGASRVVVGHGIVDEISPDRDDPSLIRAAGMRDALESGKVQYVALGDRHSVTEIEGSDGRAWYSGTPVATDYGEMNPNQVLLVQLDRGTCTVENRSVGSWTFHRPSFDLNGEEDVGRLEEWLHGVPSKHTTVVKLALRGTLGLAENARLEAVLEDSRLTFALLNTWELHSDLVVAPDDADLAALDVSGYVREALDDLALEAGRADEKGIVARDALNLLYRLAQ